MPNESIVPVLIIIVCFLLAGTVNWLSELWYQHEMKQKSRASKPVESWFVYDSKANVKQVGHELRRETRRREKA